MFDVTRIATHSLSVQFIPMAIDNLGTIAEVRAAFAIQPDGKKTQPLTMRE